MVCGRGRHLPFSETYSNLTRRLMLGSCFNEAANVVGLTTSPQAFEAGASSSGETRRTAKLL